MKPSSARALSIDTAPLASATPFGRPRRADDGVPGDEEKQREALTDDAARAGEKNLHAVIPCDANLIVGANRIDGSVENTIGRNAAWTCR